jgi:hypothetical protein
MKLPLEGTDLWKTFELRLQIYGILLPERGRKLPYAGNNAQLISIFLSGWPPGDEQTFRQCWVSLL